MQSETLQSAAQTAAPRKVAIRRVAAVVNSASGGVGPGAADTLKALLDRFGLDSRVSVPETNQIEDAVRAAVESGPDLVIVLAGDGTASRAADLCGPDGPLVAPLPGGTMNMLPRALYGNRAWPDILEAALHHSAERWVSGGEVGGYRFYCAAILGSPALLALAREAVRSGKLARAWRYATTALRRALLTRVRFHGDGGTERKAVALGLICPLVSRTCDEERALEAAILDVHDAMEVFRLGLRNMLGDWRGDPAVTVESCVRGRVWARSPIPGLFDGELRRLGRSAEIRFKPRAFRALAPGPDSGEPRIDRPSA